MVDATLLSKVKELSPEDRLELIGLVWDSLSPSDIPVTAEEKQFLDARLRDYHDNPNDTASWQDVKARLRKNLQ